MRGSWVCLVALFKFRDDDEECYRGKLWEALRKVEMQLYAAVCSWAKLYATLELNVAKPVVLFASFPVNHSMPRNADSRPTFIDKDQPIKSLGSMSRGKIFKGFNMYIKRYKSLIFSREL